MDESDEPVVRIDRYLTTLDADRRAAVIHLHNVIVETAPDAVPAWSYGMPALRSDGVLLVGYAAFTHHYSLFPMGAAVLDALGEECAPYRTSKGTLQFAYGHELPATLVRQVVRARLAENAARAEGRGIS